MKILVCIIGVLFYTPCFLIAEEKPPVKLSESASIIDKTTEDSYIRKGLSGDPDAAAELAQYYGYKVFDEDQWYRWLVIAAENGSEEGQIGLAAYLENIGGEYGKYDKMRASFWRKMAKRNHKVKEIVLSLYFSPILLQPNCTCNYSPPRRSYICCYGHLFPK